MGGSGRNDSTIRFDYTMLDPLLNNGDLTAPVGRKRKSGRIPKPATHDTVICTGNGSSIQT
jgi:hypothetical protein